MKGFQEIQSELTALSEPAVLATLVRVKGSSYRAPGARMLLGAQGRNLGAVSGGCLETDLAERAKGVLASDKPSLVKYDLGSELDLVWGTGMGCEGVAEVLLEPLKPGRLHPWVPFAQQLLSKRRGGVLATVFSVEGQAPCEVGEHFVMDENLNGILPTDQELAKALDLKAKDVLGQQRSQWVLLELSKGRLEMSLERLVPPFALWIYNAGETARPLVELAARVGWIVGVLDHRPILARPERFPEASCVRWGSPSEMIPSLDLDNRSAAVVMSHIYERDKEAMKLFLESGAAFVGLQGNRKRSEKLLRELEADGFALNAERRGKLHWPVGLDIGAESPEAIALSILAEAHAVLTGKHGGHLKDGQGSIH
jgi:xanthine/CO dehydrogenase XdhC/CoxF family maturation factor